MVSTGERGAHDRANRVKFVDQEDLPEACVTNTSCDKSHPRIQISVQAVSEARPVPVAVVKYPRRDRQDLILNHAILDELQNYVEACQVVRSRKWREHSEPMVND